MKNLFQGRGIFLVAIIGAIIIICGIYFGLVNKNIIFSIGQLLDNGNFFSASISSSLNQNNSQLNVSASAPTAPQTQPVNNLSAIVSPVPENSQDQLGGIQEKLDIINQQVQALVAQQNPTIQLVVQAPQQPSNQINQNINTYLGGGGGGVSTCTPNWTCSGFDSCANGQQTQTCTDSNSCGTTTSEPALTQSCTIICTDCGSGDSVSGSPVDATAPVITLIGNATVNLTVGDPPYADPGATASDNVDGDITANIVVVNPADANTIGDYTITYNVSDAAGNHAVQVTRLVHVIAAASVQKILINEVQIGGPTNSVADEKEEFVELYNPNGADIDLTGWYLQRETSGGSTESYVAKTLFSGKTIKANNYFLIARAGSSFAALPGMGTDNSFGLLTDNSLGDNGSSSTLVLKNSNLKTADKIVDKVGFGQVPDFEGTAPAQNPLPGQSIQRKLDSVTNKPQDTDDNSADFIIFNGQFPSSDTAITSVTYIVNSTADTIADVPYGTSKIIFEAALTKDQINQTWDDSNISDPVVTGNTLLVTAQDGTTKATYAITASATNWSQGTIDSFTPAGSFTFHTSDFMPDIKIWCGFTALPFRATYPSMTNGSAFAGGPCNSAYPFYTYDMSYYTTPGEYDLYISYCGGNNCPDNDPIGDYYRMYFDGTNWSALAVDNTKTKPSNDATVSSATYVASPLSATYTGGVFTSGTGTITNVPFATTKTIFENNLTPAAGATLDYSGITDPVVTGNTLVVTAQNGTTKATYTITADTVNWSQGTISSFTPDGHFYINDGDFMPNQPSGCTAYTGTFRDTFPSQKNGGFNIRTDCASVYGTGGIYGVDLSSYTTPGEYDFYISFCSGSQCGNYKTATGGDYYRMYFDGAIWSALSSITSGSGDTGSND
ncbi:MAG: immunoglobulin-like domain-containing protein [Candidatus Staskawiczbacteria bacterium]|jgi:hypothetical protein